MRQVTDFFTLDGSAALATVEMKNLLLINQCAVQYLPGKQLVGWLSGWHLHLHLHQISSWLVGWLVGTYQVLAGWLQGWLVGWLVGWLAPTR